MPELPEVETIIRALKNGGRGGETILGRRIDSAELLWMRTLAVPSPVDFLKDIKDRPIQDITRRGKFIVIHLDGRILLLHLRMSGDLRVDIPPLSQPQPHDRLLINFKDGYRLAFNDTRKFGRAWLLKSTESVFFRLGIEPFNEELTEERFFFKLHKKKKQIKSLLLDQSFLAGLGNIYTDESLHRANIHPLRLSSSLTENEASRLLLSIRAILQDGIDRNGASIDWVYKGGGFQNNFRVYQRTGEPCSVCGTRIKRILVGQRGTHFCPHCQPEEVGS